MDLPKGSREEPKVQDAQAKEGIGRHLIEVGKGQLGLRCEKPCSQW